MISWKDEEECRANGISLSFGEYYVLDRNTNVSSGDDDGSDVSFFEEAEEATEDELNEEIALVKNQIDEEHEKAMKDREQANTIINGTNNDGTCAPALMGMPDALLENIYHFATECAHEVCVLERVCKRSRRMAMIDEFWARHPCYCDTASYHLFRTVSDRSQGTNVRTMY